MQFMLFFVVFSSLSCVFKPFNHSKSLPGTSEQGGSVVVWSLYSSLYCDRRCGHCKGQQPCKVTEGRCITCDRGWNGTRCDQLCSKGFFGENCQEVCPTCKDGHHCDPIHGKCSHCNPGWIGDRYVAVRSLFCSSSGSSWN